MANLTDIYKKASLVMKPAAMKEGKLYSQQPHSGAGDFTFSRANGAQTRINEHGLIEDVADNTPRLSYDLVTKEGARTNEVTHSESFTNTSYWSNVIDVVASLGQGVDPDGSNTANKIQANSGSNFKILRTSAFTIPSGITMSMFVKRGNHDYIMFKAQGDFGFNLNTLTWNGNYSNVGYELYPNGWVRLHHTTTSSSLSYFGIYLTDGDFNQSWNATGDEFVYVWGAQYEESTQMTDYIPTNGEAVTIPAVVVASECPTLLLEPTRTNIITQSRELTSGDLAKANLTVSDNANIVDPTGKKNTKTITATSASQPRLEWRGTSVPSSNTNYAMSFFVRYNTARYVAIGHFSQTGEYAIFDLVDGVVEADTGTQTAKIEAYPNGWYRVSKTFEVLSTASLNYWKFTLCTQTNPFVGVSGEEADVFGLQFEASDYPTSYIPTEGSTGVRNADTAKLSNFSEIPSDNPFTVLWEGSADTYDSTGFSSQSPFSLVHSGAFNCYFSFNFVDENTMAIRRRNTSDTNNTFSVSNSDNYKIAVCYINSTTIKVYVNGVEAANSTAFSSVSFTGGEIVDTILIGQLRDGADTGKRNSCKNFALFNEELSSSELITLTK